MSIFDIETCCRACYLSRSQSEGLKLTDDSSSDKRTLRKALSAFGIVEVPQIPVREGRYFVSVGKLCAERDLA